MTTPTTKHTPGPWAWDEVPLPGVGPAAVAWVLNPTDAAGSERGRAVLRHDANGPTPWAPTAADRRLIAKAPELVEALWEILAENLPLATDESLRCVAASTLDDAPRARAILRARALLAEIDDA